MGDVFSGKKGRFSIFIKFPSTKLLSQLAPSDLQSTIISNSDGYTPAINGTALTGSGADIQQRATPSTSFAQPKALQLGGSKTNARTVAAQLTEQVVAEESGFESWGIHDLMDVNADEGDWSKLLHASELFAFISVLSFRCVRECACRCSVKNFNDRSWIWCLEAHFPEEYVDS